MNSNIIIIQNKDVIPDTHFFVYKNNKYPFKFDYFKYASEYFSSNEEILSKTKNINILDPESANRMELSDNTIKEFINYVQSKKIPLSKENVFNLNYLSNKYKVSTLKEKTEEYITNHQADLVLELLHQYQEEKDFNTKIYEEIISNNLEFYIKDDKLLDIKIPILYRIINNSTNKNKEFQKNLNDFLLKILNKKGRSASVLFEKVDFGEMRNEMLKILIKNYSNVFDFQYMNSSLIKFFVDHDEDEVKMKNYYEEEINLLKQQKEEIEKEKETIHQTIEIKDKEIENLKKEIKKLPIPLLFNKTINNANAFDGIFKYLSTKTEEGNIHDNHIIEVTSSPFYSSPLNLFNFDDSSYFISKQYKDSWICFDFKDRKVKITNYSIKSNVDRSNTHHLKSWLIEISNDGENWDKIDKQTNCSILNGSHLVGTFDTEIKEFVRYVRFRQIDETWGGSNFILAFNNLEFFGYLAE